MVLPALAVYGGIAAASALAQWFTSKDAQNASQAEIANMKSALAKIKDPQFDASSISPAEYQVMAKYTPETSQFVAEQAPELVNADSAGAQLGRQTQLEALSQLKDRIASGGFDDSAKMAFQDAADRSSQQNQQAQAAVSESMKRRGISGSGIEALLAQNGAQQANTSLAQQSRALAEQALARKDAALSQSANLGTQIRGEDVNQETQNNNTINAFRSRVAKDKQTWLNQNTNIQNDAQKYNVGVAQDVANKNAAAKYNAAVDNRTNYNNTQQNTFNDAATKTGYAQRIGNSAIDVNQSNARDTNSMISGLGDLAAIGASQYYRSGDAAGTQPQTPVGGTGYGDSYDPDQEYNRSKRGYQAL